MSRTTITILLVIWLWLPYCPSAQGETLDTDSSTLTLKVYERVSATPLLQAQYSDNVAMHHLTYRTSTSSFGMEYQWRDENQALFSEYGRGESLTHIFATTYLQPKETEHLWGFARYSTGTKKGINWNSTSDISRLYPYIVSDTLGGDLLHEMYSFGGGYSGAWCGYRLSGHLAYDAQQEYRTVDPRPRNITSHLRVSSGVSRSLGGYDLGMSLQYGIYKQRSSITFFSPLGSALQRLMSGLGDSFSRFDSNDPSVYYRGYTLGTALDLLPKDTSSGLFGSIAYQFDQIEQTLSDMNEVPIHHHANHQIQFAIAYQQKIQNSPTTWGVELKSNLQRRDGVEHIVSEPKAGTYPVVGYLPNFRMQRAHKQVAVYLSNNKGVMHQEQWWIKASLAHRYLDISKVMPEKRLLSSQWTGILSGEASRMLTSHQILSLGAEVAYAPTSKGSLQLPYATMRDYDIAHLEHSLRSLSGSFIALQVSPSYFHAFGSNTKEWGLRGSCQYRYEQYRHPGAAPTHRHCLVTTIQLVF